MSYLLRNYIAVGADEPDISKLSTVLTAKFGSLDAARQELVEVASIQETFISFQQHLLRSVLNGQRAIYTLLRTVLERSRNTEEEHDCYYFCKDVVYDDKRLWVNITIAGQRNKF